MRQQFASFEEARHAGFHPCPLCFHRFPGFSGFERDLFFGMLCSREVSTFGLQTSDVELQQSFLRAGREVVAQWPLPRREYRYRFFVLESDVTNAIAYPDGQIFITTALLEALETDQELKAVLAHETAHVEMRHFYRRSYVPAAAPISGSGQRTGRL